MAEIATLIDAISARAQALSGLGHKVRFDLTDIRETILIDATGAVVAVVQEVAEADAVLKLSSETLDKLISGKLGPMMAYSTGRLKVEGSPGVAMKLASLFD